MEGDYRPFGADSATTPSIWVIAAGVCLGSLAASFITWSAAELRLRWELEQVTNIMKRETKQVQQTLERTQREAAESIQHQLDERERTAREQRQQLAEQQRQENEVKKAAQLEAARREAAWKRFYRPSPTCVGSTATVECANEHIRASRDFEKRFAAGEL